MKLRDAHVDPAALPQQAIHDIDEYYVQNRVMPTFTLGDTLKAFLHWNGIIGYTSEILAIIEASELQLPKGPKK